MGEDCELLMGSKHPWDLLSQGQPYRKPGVATTLAGLTKHLWS